MKRILSVVLAFVISLTVFLPVFASEVNNLVKIEDKSASNSYYATYGTVTDASTNKSVSFNYSVPSGGATVLLFYSTASSNNGTQAAFSQLSNLKWASSGKLNFIAIESSKASASASSDFLEKYDKSGFIDKAYYDAEDNSLLMWYYTYIKNDGVINGSIGYNVAYCYAVIITSENSKNYIRYSISGVQSASQIASALSKVMDTSALADGYDGYLNSGKLALGKLNKAEISKILSDNPLVIPENDSDYFSVSPSVSGTYKTGTVKTAYLQAATDRLSALRKIASLPAVTMDASLNTSAQYGAVLLAASEFSHYPTKPADMTDSFFETGTEATSSSNIAAGRHLTETPDGFMKDEGTNNLPVMGHRRWQLNPTLSKVGFGFAVNLNNPNYGGSYKYYSAEKCMDTSGEEFDYRFIGWPASGNFPRQIFDYNTAWSVTLSPAYYQTPNIDNVKVTLTRTSDGKKWTFSNKESYTIADEGKYFNVETNNYAVPNCIIFRPDGIELYDGEYTVVISGLLDSFGNSVSLSYKVDFFDADEYRSIVPGWYEENGKKYYYDSNLNLVKSKLMTIDGKKYYFGKDGAMYTKRLISVSGKKYYVGSDGAAYTKRLISVSGKKYYMGADGVAYTSRLISVSGKKYYMGKDGVAYTKRLISVDGKKYYMGSDGVAYTSRLISVDGKKYYMGKDGVAYKSKLISVSGKKYYIGKDCIAYKSKFASLSGKKYYFGSDCVMYKSKTFSVSGVKWRADSYGVCKKV
ncbi:MAG: hypothetical protein E7515_06355 [Ruminococcaceae bacterium]|jgi:uncharacterized protein YkwD|nr:hypothetical protein [Oscillospiraceae bacterium]